MSDADTSLAYASAWPKAPAVAAAALLLVCAAITYVNDGAPVAAPAVGEGSIASVGMGGRASGEDLGDEAWPDQLSPGNNVPSVKRRCDGCGLIVSMREGASDDASNGPATPADFGSQWTLMAPARYTFIVKLEDGAEHRISNSDPLAWRIGERVMVIDGNPAR